MLLTRDLLHDYQERLVKHIIDVPKNALWCGLGIGKTLTTLTAIVDLRDQFEINKTLIISPLRVANSVWHKEIKAWEHTKHLAYRICTGTEKHRTSQLLLPADIYIINRENIPWLVEFYGKKWPFDNVVIDESSSFKSSKSQRFKSLKKVSPFINRMTQLTATPASNGLMDVWAQIALLDGGERLGRSMSAYKQRYFVSDYMGFKYELKDGAQKNIEDKISDITISMKSEDYLEMPDKIDLIEYINLKPSVLKKYKDFERDLVLELDTVEDNVLASNAAVLAGKLLQYASGSNYIDDTGKYEKIHSEKIDALAQIVEENPNENMLVAYNFKFDLDALVEKFPDAVVLGKDGSDIDRWNNGEIKMLLCHPASAGMGINLQHGGSMLVWFSLTWNLEFYQQFNGRLHRQGQEKSVRVIHLVAKDTIDERVMKVLQEKEITQDKLLNALKY